MLRQGRGRDKCGDYFRLSGGAPGERALRFDFVRYLLFQGTEETAEPFSE